MAKKKLQIFISSTYIDLIDERQAAVEAILSSNNIPAGMELFKAGNKSQWETIKKWIDESDIYMLILGGRYGSIESSSRKSYTQLEYEYALENGKPIFSIVLSDNYLDVKRSTNKEFVENEHIEYYDEFKKIVESKMVKFVDDLKDIKIGIFESLTELKEEVEFIGWIKADNVEDVKRFELKISQLELENKKLKEELETKQTMRTEEKFPLDLTKELSINITGLKQFMENQYSEMLKITYNDVFSALGPVIIVGKSIENAKEDFEEVLKETYKKSYYTLHVGVDVFNTIKVQLLSSNLINIFSSEVKGKQVEMIELSDNGKLLLAQLKR